MAQSNTRLSPRQKMINLMYIVLTAMLALNVSSDVLDGFTQVEDGLARTNENVSLGSPRTAPGRSAATTPSTPNLSVLQLKIRKKGRYGLTRAVRCAVSHRNCMP